MRGHHVDRVDEGGGRGSLPEGFRVDQRRHLHLVGALPLHFILLGVGETQQGLAFRFLILKYPHWSRINHILLLLCYSA